MGLLTNPSAAPTTGVGMIERHWRKASLAAFVLGLAYFALLLPYPEYTARTYFSENALLPGLVRPEFGHQEDVERYLSGLKEEALKYTDSVPFPWLGARLRQMGLEVYTHNYTLHSPMGQSGRDYSGQNLYAILRAPRASSTESLVLSVPYRPPTSMEPGTAASMALMLGLAGFFKRQIFWAKDIIFVITQHEQLGMQAWLEAYHQRSCGLSGVLDSGDLPARAGAIQAAINLEIASPTVTHFNVKVEGLNGQLPNLDLVNLVHRLSEREGLGQMFQSTEDHPRPYSLKGFQRSARTLLSMVLRQASGVPSGNHGLFHRFGVEAVTIEGVLKQSRKARANRESDLHTMGRVVEGIFRSLNNLLERFHQSFFFYLLPSCSRYVSIGMYMPAFGFLGGSIVIAVIGLWFDSIRHDVEKHKSASRARADSNDDKKDPRRTKRKSKANREESTSESQSEEEGEEDAAEPFPPVVVGTKFSTVLPVLILAHFLGVIVVYLPRASTTFGRDFGLESEDAVSIGLAAFFSYVLILPTLIIWRTGIISADSWRPLKCLALAELAVLVFTLSLSNFSLAFLVTALYAPVAVFIVNPSTKMLGFVTRALITLLVHPMVLCALICAVDTFRVFPEYGVMRNLMHSAHATKRAVMYSVTDSYIYGNVNFGIASVFLFPCWFLLYCVNFAKAT